MALVSTSKRLCRPSQRVGLIPDVAFIPFHVVLAEQQPQFILEAHPLMMLLLVDDVTSDLFEVGLAYRKVRIPALPLKIEVIAALLFQPEVGNPFDFFHPPG